MRRLQGVIALILLLGGCAARSEPRLRAELAPVERLRADLAALFNAASVDHAQWAAHFYSLRTGETLYSLNPSRLMIPASNQKLLTAAVAAERLGWDYRFTTRILSTAPVGPDGVIDGDLVIVGSGDPTINPRHPDRWRAFDDWAAALASRGVRVIHGRLIGDDNAFEEPGWGMGWSWDDLPFGYGAAATALQYHENLVEILVGPGLEPGTRAIISTSPPGSGLIVDHDVATAVPGERARIELVRVPGSPYLRIKGRIPAGSKPVTLTAAVDNPTRFYLTAFREALARHRIFVSGSLADVDELAAPPRLDHATELIVDYSPPLAEVVDVMLKWSRNIYAETLLLASSAHDGAPADDDEAIEVMKETLQRWGIVPGSYIPRDGSGLSRYDYVTAGMLTSLLTYLWADPAHAAPFQAALPVAGISGTLAQRLTGTPAEGRVRAKTGTLSNVRALSGYLTTLNGETIVFSILVNHFRVSVQVVDDIIDRAVLRVVTFSREAPSTR